MTRCARLGRTLRTASWRMVAAAALALLLALYPAVVARAAASGGWAPVPAPRSAGRKRADAGSGARPFIRNECLSAIRPPQGS